MPRGEKVSDKDLVIRREGVDPLNDERGRKCTECSVQMKRSGR